MTRIMLSLVAFSLLAGCTAPGGDSGKGTSPTGGTTTAKCDEDGDLSACDQDCDDSNPLVFPGASETCNGIDDNCDSQVDEGVTGIFYADADGDGFGDPLATAETCEAGEGYVSNPNDCDDTNNVIYPGNAEICDGIDNNCDGTTDEGVSNRYYADADADGHGDPAAYTDACEAPPGYAADTPATPADDCDDTARNAFPGNAEACDEVDNNCDGVVDEGVTNTYYADRDADGYGDAGATQPACAVPSGYASNSDDCDDSNGDVSPVGTELCNGIDDNCDGQIDETGADAGTWYDDADGDGYGDSGTGTITCSPRPTQVNNGDDCNDAMDTIYPGAQELCDSRDNDCNGSIDDNAVDADYYYIDADGDGYGNSGVSVTGCSAPTGYVSDYSDCNDGATAVYPGATELCDSLDNDCDGATDEDASADAGTWYADLDQDLYGDLGNAVTQCEQPTGYVANSTDCDDYRDASYPGAPEYCNGEDDDCDGTVDEDGALDVATWYQDSDGDGYGSLTSDIDCSQPLGYVADNTDCNDGDAAVSPGGTEACNGIDDNCDGDVDEAGAIGAITWYRDADVDTYGDPNVSLASCDQPAGYTTDNNDCGDLDNSVFPGAAEICDGVDDDCNGLVDDNPIAGSTYYLDNDGDGFGDPANTTTGCGAPAGYVDNYYDCNDGDLGEPVVADAANGSTSASGTLADPFLLLQDAIDAAFQCVVAYPGTYNGQVDLDGKSIDLWGIEGSDRTIIDGGQTECTMINPGDCGSTMLIASGGSASPTIHGFTITGGTGHGTSSTASAACADSVASHNGRNTCTVDTWAYKGGGVYINGDDPFFSDVQIRGNTLPVFAQEEVAGSSFAQIWMYSYGGGVSVENSAAVFDDVWVYDNYADQGGGIWGGAASAFSFEHGYVAENEASDGAGVALDGGGATFTNAAIYCNVAATDGGGLFADGAANFSNTAFYRNESNTVGSARGAEAYVATSGTLYLYNSVIEAASAAYALYGAGLGFLEYNSVYNASGGTYGGTLVAGVGSISSSGNFTSVTCDGNLNNENFMLTTGASARNAGNPAPGYEDPDGSYNDMGAYGGPGGDWN